MIKDATSRIPHILRDHQAALLDDWQRELSTSVRRQDLMSDSELRSQCAEFLQLLTNAAQRGDLDNAQGPQWTGVREMLTGISRSRALQGFTATETATFVFSFKRPLFSCLRQEAGSDPEALAADVWAATRLLDGLGLWTTDAYMKAREEVIARQQEELLELSTPVVKLWDGVLALPIIGTLDSARTQTIMENLLQTIVDTGAEVAIIDITGVPTVDTLTAQHLLKTVTAARLMGADCIISGIRPQIAQTIVHLGVELGEVTTKASLADAFSLALRRMGVGLARTTGHS
jgi:rsbT co-antagonist protein RsbR